MSLRLFMDVHVPRAVVVGSRLKGIDVLTAQEDGSALLDDLFLLNRATELRRVLFSQDSDLLREATEHQKSETVFSGVIYAHQLRAGIGQCVEDLALMAQVLDEGDVINQIVYLPP